MYMSLFLCFCFYENLQELNGVRTRMDREKDEFLFLEKLERRESLSLSFSKGWLVAGGMGSVDSKRIIEAQ